MICVVLVGYSFYWIVVIELINFINLFCRIVAVNCVVVLYHMKGNFILSLVYIVDACFRLGEFDVGVHVK